MGKQIAIVRQDTGDTVLVDDGDLQAIVKSESQNWLVNREQRLMYGTGKEYGYKDEYFRRDLAKKDNILHQEMYSIRRRIMSDANTAGVLGAMFGGITGFIIGMSSAAGPPYDAGGMLGVGAVAGAGFGIIGYILGYLWEEARSLARHGFRTIDDLAEYEERLKDKYLE